MRKLPILAAVKHAVNSVIAFRGAGIRIGLLWMIVLLAIELAGLLVGGQPAETPSARFGFFELIQLTVGTIALNSISVGWHRFVLRDELPSAQGALRLDDLVWRYTGNSLLITFMTFAPVAILIAIFAVLLPPATILVAPAVVVAATATFILSLKLPAVALGRTDFGFAEAMKAAEGNFWQIMGTVLLSALIVFALIFLLAVFAGLLNFLPPPAAAAGVPLAAVAVNLFIILFGASMLTSLYGFFVERRDF